MEADQTKYIDNIISIDKFALNDLEKQWFSHLIKNIFTFQGNISCSNPVNICSNQKKASQKEFSIYSGFGGYLYLYLKLYKYSLLLKDNRNLQFYKENFKEFAQFQNIFDSDKLLQSCENLYKSIKPLISSPIENEHSPMITFYMGRPGIMVLQAFLSYYQGNEKDFLESIKELKKIMEFSVVYQGEMYHEMLYGSAGLLYCFLVLQEAFQCCELKTFRLDLKLEIFRLTKFVFLSTVNKTFQRLTVTIFNTEYLGAAHGIFGTLYVLMSAYEILTKEYLSSMDTELEASLYKILEKTLEFCLNLQFPSGNFSSTIDLDDPDQYLQYCHGSPGIIPLLIYANSFFKKNNPELAERSINAALKAGEDLWKRGLLKKGFNLCHGISGNAYSFISLYNYTKKEIWLKRAYSFAVCSTLDDRIDHIINGYDSMSRYKVGVADHPFSLMEGLAGHLCLLIDLDSNNISQAKFPGLII